MTLTVEPKQVKLPRQAWLLWLVSLLTAAGALAFVATTNGAAQTRSAYSQTLADNLATLSLEPFVAQDQIQLGLLCNRIGRLPHVAAVTIVDLGERVLASTGATTLSAPVSATTNTSTTTSIPTSTQRGDRDVDFASANVSRDNTVLGTVRVQLNPTAFAQTPTWRHWLFAFLWAVFAPVAVLGARYLWHRVNTPTGTKVVDVAFADAPPEAAQTFVISANLFNRLGLDPQAQRQAQDMALSRAKQIAPLYGGSAHELEQTAVCMRFPDHGQEDAAFAALCAGMLWAECLQQVNEVTDDDVSTTDGDSTASTCAYRFGGHRLEAGSHENSNTQEAEQEAQLLSAVASNGQLAISATMLAQIERPERLELQPAEHPLHEDLNTVGDCLYQVHSIAAHYAALLRKQAAALNAAALNTQSQPNAG